MEWNYLYLDSRGRLVYENGAVANRNWPTFGSVVDAETYLSDEDIRANCMGNLV